MEHDIDYINALTKAQLNYLEKVYHDSPPFVYNIDTDTAEYVSFKEWAIDLMRRKNGNDNSNQ